MRIHQRGFSRYLSCPRSLAACSETVSQVQQGAVTGAFVTARLVRARLIGPLVSAQGYASGGRFKSEPRASFTRRFHRLLDGRGRRGCCVACIWTAPSAGLGPPVRFARIPLQCLRSQYPIRVACETNPSALGATWDAPRADRVPDQWPAVATIGGALSAADVRKPPSTASLFAVGAPRWVESPSEGSE